MQAKRRFPKRVDFVTCPSYLGGKPGSRERAGMLPNTGPIVVITNLATYSFEDREMVLKTFHEDAGITIDQAKSDAGWDIKVADDVKPAEPPTLEELTLLREKIDPTLDIYHWQAHSLN